MKKLKNNLKWLKAKTKAKAKINLKESLLNILFVVIYSSI